MNTRLPHDQKRFGYEPIPSDARIDLFADILTGGSDLRVRVTGYSMKPFLQSGDIVTIRDVAIGSLKTGDIILCKGNDGVLVLHRLLKIRRNGSVSGGVVLYTKGDALNFMDLPFQSTQCLGKVISIVSSDRHAFAPGDMLCLQATITNRFRAWYQRCRCSLLSIYRSCGKLPSRTVRRNG